MFGPVRRKLFILIIGFMLGTVVDLFWNWKGISSEVADLQRWDKNSTFTVHQRSDETNRLSFLSTSKAKHELQNNLILGAAVGLNLSVLHRFVQSTRTSCNLCTITLLVHDFSMRSDHFRLLSDVFHVVLIPYQQFLLSNKHETFVMKSIHSQRWTIFSSYLQTLQKEGKAFDNVFICDVSDTIFQANVFKHMNKMGDGLYVFLEDIHFRISKSNINANWIRVCYGEQMLQQIGNKSISCSGTVLGSWPAITTYLSTMTAQFLNLSRACLKMTGNDQGVHNFIIHNGLIPDTTIYLIPHETGFVATAGLPKWLKRNKFGHILNSRSEIYAVVHQINRSPQLLAQFDRIYQTLPDDILNRKA
ncbi:unnamed protein product [Rotaria socialis]|uniref:Uncharacterized protein n=2 Tax=Rotaria socialis TaxID=392032 RepID=A0A818PBY4_9BILA|nr:unnamed protein product [Rotaria socialis]CAF3733288.1 unnamed protein product [Rotaria socialis]CAF3770238.1 unnamed protein product [Rotaria socialis]